MSVPDVSLPASRPSAPAWARLPLSVRIAGFRLLESMVEARRLHKMLPPSPTPDGRSLWVFVSTIGELNAIEPFIRRLREALGMPPLTLISDRAHYSDAYRARFPEARTEVLSGTWSEARALAARCPPLLLLVAEIPCQLHDAPCRFSYAVLHAARHAGASIALVNGWLYGYRPPSRMDRLENFLFHADYLRGFDLMMVQTEQVRQQLLRRGAEPKRVVVTGNIKFDAMADSAAPGSATPLSEALRARGAGPVIVAGSVTETADQRGLLTAFAQVRAVAPNALLVLAPRHPENTERMQALHGLLDSAGLQARLRSRCTPADAVAGPVLVIDTMGELRSCYAAATWAFVGTDHNVLEPLAFGKPVYVSDGWDPTYPSYPVYRQMKDAGVLHSADEIAALGPLWVQRMSSSARHEVERQLVERVISSARGAVHRGMEALHNCAETRRLLRPAVAGKA